MSRKKRKEDHDPINDLPFVQDRDSWKVGDKRLPRDFWRVKATGDTQADCELGNEYARLALDYANAQDGGFRILGWAVLDMIEKPEKSGGENKMVIVGFMGEIARYAAYGRKILAAYDELQPGGASTPYVEKQTAASWRR